MAHLFFVGTGSGKTSLSRYHSSIIISTSNYNLLIDAGDGISKAFLQHNIDFNSIDGILLTHLHPDHYTGLASLIVQMKMYGRKNDLNIFVSSELENVIRNFITTSYLFPDRLGFRINYHPFDNDVQFKILSEIKILPRQNSHLALVSESKKGSNLSFSCHSFLMNVNNKNILYTSDIGSEKDIHLFDDYDPDYFISEITHVQPEDLIKKTAEFKNSLQIILTHYSDEDITITKKFIGSLSEDIKSMVKLAFDGLKVDL